MPDIEIPPPQGRKDETKVGIIIAMIQGVPLAGRAYRLQPSTPALPAEPEASQR